MSELHEFARAAWEELLGKLLKDGVDPPGDVAIRGNAAIRGDGFGPWNGFVVGWYGFRRASLFGLRFW